MLVPIIPIRSRNHDLIEIVFKKLILLRSIITFGGILNLVLELS